jgi:hypothetical protein
MIVVDYLETNHIYIQFFFISSTLYYSLIIGIDKITFMRNLSGCSTKEIVNYRSPWHNFYFNKIVSLSLKG